jgi:CubicO group peptidase (beta-lactamase class C family)
MYQVSMDLLGVLVARVSGQSLGAFMRDRIFNPLGMKDTGFYVPSEKSDRLPDCYVFNHKKNAFDIVDSGAASVFRTPPAYESGGGGLVSTMDDYFVFTQMMLNKGRDGGEQVLSRASVELMTSDQVAPEQRSAPNSSSVPMRVGGLVWPWILRAATSFTVLADSAGREDSAQSLTWIR